MSDPDLVARLIREAGARPPVPPERFERVREVARWAWREEVGRRRGRRVRIAAALLATAAVLVLAAVRTWPVRAPAGPPAFRIEALAGTATSGSRELAVGDALSPGAQIQTAGDGRVALRLDTGQSIRLDVYTTLSLGRDGALTLARGALYIDSRVAPALTVHTPFGRVHEIGTQFEVRIDPEALVLRLREGSVVLERDAAARLEVSAGSELWLSRDGSVVRRQVSAHAPEWNWISGITPMLDLEGQTARAFLEWVARERGLKLEFADPATARAATEAVLAGTVRRLTIDQALDAVLPSAGLRHQIDAGVLVVTAAD